MNDTKAFFNQAARVWDTRKLPDAGKIETVLMLSDIRPGAVVLDAGCGTGVLEPYLLKYHPKRILAVDFAENMIDTARAKLRDARVQFQCADIFDLEPGAVSCDYCFFYNAFPHFNDPKQLIAHLATLMAAGGRVTISHTQGVKTAGNGAVPAGSAAATLVRLLEPYFRPDVIIDNNVLLMVSALVLK
ncbi:MAG: class I SAM-dependent methyltransferase [Oscillospiraceae bacterium]|jgi:demethylmenaquinone methyltransferase/2-methoxy-6-polyprenyl-1,4-benzoquinol methylase|nr:class I SAM-dependent methyltransferase [Oscillospiraceae bacterium]